MKLNSSLLIAALCFTPVAEAVNNISSKQVISTCIQKGSSPCAIGVVNRTIIINKVTYNIPPDLTTKLEIYYRENQQKLSAQEKMRFLGLTDSLQRMESRLSEVSKDVKTIRKQSEEITQLLKGDNNVLFDTTRSDAEKALNTLKALHAEERCKKGWDTLIQLRATAKEQEQKKNINMAVQVYQNLTDRAIEIKAFLTAMDMITSSTKDLEVTQGKNALAMASAQAEVAKHEYSFWRGSFQDQYSNLELAAAKFSRKIDWTQIREIDLEADSLARAGQYADARDKMIEGFNQLTQTFDSMMGRRPTPPIPKQQRIAPKFPSIPLPQNTSLIAAIGSVCN